VAAVLASEISQESRKAGKEAVQKCS